MAQGFTRGIPIDTDPTLSSDSDLLVASQKATKAYVDTELLSKQDAINLTTTSTSGPATLVGNTLNIPEYAGAGLMKSSTFTAPNPIAEYSTNIVDADCLTTSTIIISHSPTSETDANSDEVIGIRAYPLNGSFTLIAQAVTSNFLNGTYKFNYIIK
jgi:hypothetical protein